MKRKAFMCGMALLGSCTAVSMADTTAAKSSPFAALGQPTGSGPDVNTSALHVDLGVDFTNADFFRGVRQPVSSPTFQTYADVHFEPIKIGDLTLGSYVGTRNGGAEKSHNGAPLTDYLQEIFVGGTARCQAWSVDFGYAEHHSPDGTFGTQNEIGARFDYDDSEMAKSMHLPLSLHPHVAIFKELIDQNAGGSFRSEPQTLNSYVEIGIAPQTRIKLGDNNAWSINVAVPVTLGMSWDNYYSLVPGVKSSPFGFTSVGILGSISLPVPSNLGAWDLRGGVTWINDEAAGARLVDQGHNNFFVAGLGIAMHY